MALCLTCIALLRQPYKQACFLSSLLFLCLLKCKLTPNVWLHLSMLTCAFLFTKRASFFLYWWLLKLTTASMYLKKIVSCVFSFPKSHLSPKSQVSQSRGCILYKFLSPCFVDCGWALPLLRDSALHIYTEGQSKAGWSTEDAKRADSWRTFTFSLPVPSIVSLNHVFHVLSQNNVETPVEGPK